ncbi:radical SAM family heme chaperone HemW [Roseibium salinum]|uniref:Heme chaperone HemW n=1 Tax=Roseibium salinum TaxID=1604349 RepID=A0ABT3R6U9_9HYPH|nr:radical SAM family heme chaperone HemW [Roseibium sp. DSM 29163]MCX2724763.1 radical SAM family heme chaperone HemW [Roseibium sp. DSM 29163]MDN3721254.1 radical SAM family heme chaperone HemW [Roseibium salinum]
MTQAVSDGGFGIYVHWPFCAAKCPYCDFNSHVRHQPVDQTRYTAAFERELAHFAELTRGRTVQSIFLGGGTPSLMDPATVERILTAVSGHWSLDPEVEISLEANPSSVEAERFREYRGAGVNRVSLGVQSLIDTDLRLLGRLHDAETARRAIETARATFPRLSFDLIYARPGQTLEGWKRELKQAIDLAADHLSLYQLTIEEGTPFHTLYHAGKLQMPDQDLGAAFYELTQDITAEAGLPAYEVSNHARPGAECRHNLVYWRYGDYVGVGPGAHGRLTVGASRLATATERHPETWLENVEEHGHGLVENAGLSEEEQGDEFLLMGLRLTEGIDLGRYERFAHRSIDPRRLNALLEHRMVEELGENRVRATREGFFVLDAVVADLAS